MDFVAKSSNASSFSGNLKNSSYLASTGGSSYKKFDPFEYSFHYQFQSHEPDFDCLKSLEIEEKINMIRFLPHQNQSLTLLSSNDKTVKLWKVSDKTIKKVATLNVIRDEASASILSKPRSSLDLRLPALNYEEIITTSVNKNSYQNAHAYQLK